MTSTMDAEDSYSAEMNTIVDCRQPLLIGVRHHSAVMARAIIEMLDAFNPECVLLELPGDMADWIEHLADEDTIAPVAISAVDNAGSVFFYPMADFSPELVAIRWASRHNIPVVPCDLSVSCKTNFGFDDEPSIASKNSTADSLGAACRRLQCSDSGELWQRLVESPGCHADHESLRRAALRFGWIVRSSTPAITARDSAREAAMRSAIRNAPPHSVAVVGSFHAAALTPEVIGSTTESDESLLKSLAADSDAVGVSLTPYSFEQLDERSGYPAGIRDPVWHQRMLLAYDGNDLAGNRSRMDVVATELATQICRRLRSAGHVAGTPDATEAIRVMRDLARIRMMESPGRGEFLEAIETCLIQGDLLGRGRAVAKAASEVLIGNRNGTVTSRAPRCGLAVDLDAQIKQLRLPDRDSQSNQNPSKEFRLDVLRTPRDRARAVFFRRLNAAGIPYAKRVDTVERGHRENLIERWDVAWQQSTSATIEAVARFGVTLSQVVDSIARGIGPDESDAASELPATTIRRLQIAAECGLVGLTRCTIESLSDQFRASASLNELVAASSTLSRIQAGHVIGLPRQDTDAYPPIVQIFESPELSGITTDLLRTCLDRLDGLAGSQQREDVDALVDLIDYLTSDAIMPSNNQTPNNAGIRLVSWCRRVLRTGSDRMRGAAAGAMCQLGSMNENEFTVLTRGWYDAAVDRDHRSRLQQSLAGGTQVLLPRMQVDETWLAGIDRGLRREDDTRFLAKLPSLRAAFAEFSPADRQRLLDCCLSILSQRRSNLKNTDISIDDDAELVADEYVRLRSADLAGRELLKKSHPMIGKCLASVDEDWTSDVEVELDDTNVDESEVPGEISLADRWRLIFGLPPDSKSPKASRAASTLDELYGHGSQRGEGSRGGLSNRPGSSNGPGGGGTESPEPTTNDLPSTETWAEELEALFGSDVCQEVLGQSAASGRSGVIDLLDGDAVVPSVELLQQVLSLSGGLGEGKLERLRMLAQKITDDLAKQLAVRLQTALSGLSTPRPTRRRSRRLNLSRTIQTNLVNAHRRVDGRATIVAERLVFNAPAKREMDWHLTFVVDVSASMSASVIYSALVATILDALPAISVRFLAFSTEIIDFSGQVSDPLSLLLEVQVGGGTDIGLGLRAAREGIQVPSRSLVVLISDFEEGCSVSAMLGEVRALVDAGVKCLGLASLDDDGQARFHQGYAQMVAAAGMPVAAVSPARLAQWIGDQIRSHESGNAGATVIPEGVV